MPIYVYETIDETRAPRRFEVKQSIHDPPLEQDPATGEKVRRVISGGIAIPRASQSSPATPAKQGSCGPGCGCH